MSTNQVERDRFEGDELPTNELYDPRAPKYQFEDEIDDKKEID